MIAEDLVAVAIYWSITVTAAGIAWYCWRWRG